MFPPQSGVLEAEIRTAERVAKIIFDRNLARVERHSGYQRVVPSATL